MMKLHIIYSNGIEHTFDCSTDATLAEFAAIPNADIVSVEILQVLP